MLQGKMQRQNKQNNFDRSTEQNYRSILYHKRGVSCNFSMWLPLPSQKHQI